MVCNAPPPLSRLVTPHSRLPSRLPGPDCATMFRLIGLGMSTTSPRRSRCSGPSVRLRIGHVPAAATGAATLLSTTVCACPELLVSVAIKLPTAISCGCPEPLFCTAKLLMLNVPAMVPLPSELRELSGPEVGAVNVPATGTASDVCPWGLPLPTACENIIPVLSNNVVSTAIKLRFFIALLHLLFFLLTGRPVASRAKRRINSHDVRFAFQVGCLHNVGVMLGS